MAIVDTSVLLAYFDTDEPDHPDVCPVLEVGEEPRVVSPFVIAELDFMLTKRRGVPAECAALRELSGGAWDLPPMTAEDLALAVDIVERYADQKIGITDASLVVLAKRYGTRTIATLDRRHFDVLRPLDGGHFTVVP